MSVDREIFSNGHNKVRFDNDDALRRSELISAVPVVAVPRADGPLYEWDMREAIDVETTVHEPDVNHPLLTWDANGDTHALAGEPDDYLFLSNWDLREASSAQASEDVFVERVVQASTRAIERLGWFVPGVGGGVVAKIISSHMESPIKPDEAPELLAFTVGMGLPPVLGQVWKLVVGPGRDGATSERLPLSKWNIVKTYVRNGAIAALVVFLVRPEIRSGVGDALDISTKYIEKISALQQGAMNVLLPPYSIHDLPFALAVGILSYYLAFKAVYPLVEAINNKYLNSGK